MLIGGGFHHQQEICLGIELNNKRGERNQTSHKNVSPSSWTSKFGYSWPDVDGCTIGNSRINYLVKADHWPELVDLSLRI